MGEYPIGTPLHSGSATDANGDAITYIGKNGILVRPVPGITGPQSTTAFVSNQGYPKQRVKRTFPDIAVILADTRLTLHL